MQIEIRRGPLNYPNHLLRIAESLRYRLSRNSLRLASRFPSLFVEENSEIFVDGEIRGTFGDAVPLKTPSLRFGSNFADKPLTQMEKKYGGTQLSTTRTPNRFYNSCSQRCSLLYTLHRENIFIMKMRMSRILVANQTDKRRYGRQSSCRNLDRKHRTASVRKERFAIAVSAVSLATNTRTKRETSVHFVPT